MADEQGVRDDADDARDAMTLLAKIVGGYHDDDGALWVSKTVDGGWQLKTYGLSPTIIPITESEQELVAMALGYKDTMGRHGECHGCGAVVTYKPTRNDASERYTLAECDHCGGRFAYQESGRTLDVSGFSVASNIVTRLPDVEG